MAPTFDTTVLLRSGDAGGHLSVVENTVPAHWGGPPLHLHGFDETFYVLDGELTFRLREELLSAGPGDCVFAPRDVPHTLANRSDAPARYLVICTPAGFERYFDRLAAEQAGREVAPEAMGPTPEVTTVGPPITT